MKKRLLFAVAYILFCIAVCILTFIIVKATEPEYIQVKYTVIAGDTYSSLAEYFGITEEHRDWRERVKLLNCREDSTLYAGETIYVLIEEAQNVLQ